MGKSKFQIKAKNTIKKKKNSGNKPKYYDENISNSKKNSSFVIFIIFVMVIGGGIYGIISFSNLNNDENINEIDTQSWTTTETSSENQNSDYKTDITITTIYDEQINLADNAGKVVVLYFHYISCFYCKDTGKNLDSAMKSYSTDELLVISIDVKEGDSAADLENWATENGYTWPMSRDPNGEIASRYNVRGTPTMAFLGKDGSTGNILVGGEKSQADIEAEIDNLL